METFPRLSGRLTNLGSQLSGRAADALDRPGADDQPDAIILDEATEGLAPLIVAEIWRVIASIRRTGIATLIVDRDYRKVCAEVRPAGGDAEGAGWCSKARRRRCRGSAAGGLPGRVRRQDDGPDPVRRCRSARPPRVVREDLPDGGFILRSPEPLQPFVRCIGEWLGTKADDAT